MSIQEQLVTLLGAVAPIFPATAAQGLAPPYLIYQRVVTTTNNVLDGNGNPPVNNTRFQIDAWGGTYAAAQALAASVTAAMLGWSMQNVKLDEQDGYEEDVKLYRVILDFDVWHYS